MVARLGSWFKTEVKNFLYASGFLLTLLRESILFIKRRQVGFRVLVMQILFTAVEALGIISLISLSLGAVIIIQGITILPKFGQGNLIYTILIIVITRELGPILTAFIIIARSGTAIATELGNMVVSHEIEAYLSVGINPFSYLLVPRFLGVILSMMLLTVYFNLFGLFGSYVVTQFVKPIQFLEYFRNLLSTMEVVDIISSLIKSIVFGIIIGFIATYQGFHVQIASTEIPQIAIKAVGQGFVLCILANALITMIYYI
ncbi:MAG TPA: ABC transporter permease [Spirochaetales bacterium]|nr:ABC transporter permease [Spirochaetales bacterium]